MYCSTTTYKLKANFSVGFSSIIHNRYASQVLIEIFVLNEAFYVELML